MKSEGLIDSVKRVLAKKGAPAVILGILAGIILMLLPGGGDTETVESVSTLTSAEYCALLEQKAERLICELESVDDCAVFITLESGYRYIYASDQHVRETEAGKETDKTIVLADGTNGEAPILVAEDMPAVAGVAVVCSGASYETQYRIIELICALFDIKSNRISVQT